MLAAGLGNARAADMPVPATAPYPPAATYQPVAAAPFDTWTGCFLGGNFGGAWSSWQVSVAGLSLNNRSAQSLAGGAQGGCDFQFGDFVIGIEGKGDGTDLKTAAPTIVGGIRTTNLQENWFATLTGRVGYVIQPAVLVYAKGGAAWVGQAGTGWTAGGGLEWKLLPHWSVFVEYDYLGLGNNATTFAFVPPVVFGSAKLLSLQAALVGFNYRFNFGYATTRY
jgi:outer membrane immunogenic protein